MNKLLRTLRPENLAMRSKMREEEERKLEQERLQRDRDFAQYERLYVENNYSSINHHLRNMMMQ